jgi:hypothetical protein
MNPMLRLFAVTVLLALLSPAAGAQDWVEPERGSELRTDLLSSIRPHIEWALGPPIEFVVWEMRVRGDIAFASLWAQRPGGGQIDLRDTPAARRGILDPDVGDGPGVQVLYIKSGRVWVALHYAINATERWYSDKPFCDVWASVIPEACQF